MSDQSKVNGSNGGLKVPMSLENYVKIAAREAAWTVIKEHIGSCPVGDLEDRVRVLEGRFNILIGAIIGSGVLGGAAGALVGKMIGV